MHSLVQLSLRVFLGAEAIASAYGYVQRLVEDQPTMIGSWTVSPDIVDVFFVFAFAFGVLGTVALSWHWISRVPFMSQLLYSKSSAFGDLYDEIAQRRDELIGALDDSRESPKTLEYIAKLQELHVSPKALSIRCPERVPNTEITHENKPSFIEWATFLIGLAAVARNRDLKGARASYPRNTG